MRKWFGKSKEASTPSRADSPKTGSKPQSRSSTKAKALGTTELLHTPSSLESSDRGGSEEEEIVWTNNSNQCKRVYNFFFLLYDVFACYLKPTGFSVCVNIPLKALALFAWLYIVTLYSMIAAYFVNILPSLLYWCMFIRATPV